LVLTNSFNGLYSYCKLCRRIYRKENRNKINKYNRDYEKERRLKDIHYKLCKYLRTRISNALTLNWKQGSAVKDLGCSIIELKTHLESKFQEGMSWDNYGEWHIDHIKPLSKFQLKNKDEFLLAVHYTNLQPLWAEDNLKKGNKME